MLENWCGDQSHVVVECREFGRGRGREADGGCADGRWHAALDMFLTPPTHHDRTFFATGCGTQDKKKGRVAQ